jgi:spore photoproduct lyase
MSPDRPQRYLIEPEFLGRGFFPALSPQVMEPLTATDYPRLRAGDLALTRHRGSFIRPCPATLQYNCCGLNIIHIGQGCHLGCGYCVLTGYLGSEAVIRFGNFEEGLTEVAELLAAIKESEARKNQPGPFNPRAAEPGWAASGLTRPSAAAPSLTYPEPPLPPERSYRFCTGEFTDSLIFDQGFGVSARLIELFRSSPQASLELKTKTREVSHLLGLDHGGRTVLSFSVNSPTIAASLEARAAPLGDRLAAAGRAAANGYPLGLHFDPIVYYPGWREGYARAVGLMDQTIPWSRVAWISLGCFRYQAPLKSLLLARPGSAKLFDAEFVRAPDGKYRYPRPLRQLLYGTILSYLKPRVDPRATIYLCMESPRMWREVMGFDPTTQGLATRFREPPLASPWELCPNPPA